MAYLRTELETDENKHFWNMWNALLNDDEGVNEKGYEALCQFAESIDPKELENKRREVDATDGRFYIKE